LVLDLGDLDVAVSVFGQYVKELADWAVPPLEDLDVSSNGCNEDAIEAEAQQAAENEENEIRRADEVIYGHLESDHGSQVHYRRIMWLKRGLFLCDAE
jgi:hypothetical protein